MSMLGSHRTVTPHEGAPHHRFLSVQTYCNTSFSAHGSRRPGLDRTSTQFTPIQGSTFMHVSEQTLTSVHHRTSLSAMLPTLKPAIQLELDPPPRVAVVPLGTGNDLSLSFGWGNAFLPAWLRNFPSVYHMLRRVADAQPRELDCWRISLSAGEHEFTFHPTCDATRSSLHDVELPMQPKMSTFVEAIV